MVLHTIQSTKNLEHIGAKRERILISRVWEPIKVLTAKVKRIFYMGFTIVECKDKIEFKKDGAKSKVIGPKFIILFRNL